MLKRKWDFKEKGKNVTIYTPITLIKSELALLKSNILISEFCYLNAGLGLYIGNYIHISAYCSIIGGGYCVLEDFVGISAGTRIITGSEQIMGNGLSGGPTIPDKYRENYQSYVICKKHSFLATNCIIHPGVTIGEGSVVGSGSIVTRDLEPWGIYRGVPAKRVKDRPSKKMLELEKELLKEYNVKPSDFSHVYEKINNLVNNLKVLPDF